MTPRPAATLLLLRDTPRGLAVFMVQRSLTSSFMPGAYVFPGGAVDPTDHADARFGGVDDPAAAFGGRLPEQAARAHLVAAAREAFEEAGVRLPTLAGLRAWSHWITPPIETRRFDTWFLAAADPGGDARHDDAEVIDSRWVEPGPALRRYGDGDMLLAPPTWYTLWELSHHRTVAEVLAAPRALPPIQPSFQEIDDRMCLLLPGDPLHPADEPVDGPCRLAMGEGGRWWAVDARVG